jgi:hypothetical protein
MAGAFPFLISIFLVGLSLFVRLKMKESPIFTQMKNAGMASTQPLQDAITKWANLRQVLISLFGATAGQGVVWYTGQCYGLFYLQTILKVAPRTANIVIAIALMLGMPFLTAVGALSDRMGRKRLMMAGCLIAVRTYIPSTKPWNVRRKQCGLAQVHAQQSDRRHRPDSADHGRHRSHGSGQESFPPQPSRSPGAFFSQSLPGDREPAFRPRGSCRSI